MPIGDYSYAVNTDLSSSQFKAVYLANTGYILAATSAYPMAGILQDNPDGSSKVNVGSVRELGHSKAIADVTDGAISAGSPLRVSVNTAGRLEPGTLGTHVIVAVAMEAATVSGQIFEVALAARTAQGVTARAGQLHFSFPISAMRTTGNMLAAVPLGFVGTITGAYAICETVASTSESGATASISFGVGGASSVTGLAIAMTASSVVLGAVTAGTGTVGGTYTFGATDTLYITVTQGGTQFSASDTGRVGIYVEYN